MSYEKSKIYKLQCDDGHYYFGSTRGELSRRFYEHKRSSLRQPYRVYQHINSIGWEKVAILLVEEFSCSNRKELLQKENEYIVNHRTDNLCLNTICSTLTEEERKENKRKLNEKYKDKLAEYHKEKRTGNPEVEKYQKQYRESHKEEQQKSKQEY